jgi:long-subunit acyl-CoA synthetase (AMP-forming)
MMALKMVKAGLSHISLFPILQLKVWIYLVMSWLEMKYSLQGLTLYKGHWLVILVCKFIETLQYAKPTIFMAVPRVFEKMEEKLKEIATQAPGILQRLSGWAKSKGTAHSDSRIQGKGKPFGYSIAHFLVLGRIKKALGLDEAKVLIVGAAPLKKATFTYFKSLDLPIMNCYGMSE